MVIHAVAEPADGLGLLADESLVRSFRLLMWYAQNSEDRKYEAGNESTYLELPQRSLETFDRTNRLSLRPRFDRRCGRASVRQDLTLLADSSGAASCLTDLLAFGVLFGHLGWVVV